MRILLITHGLPPESVGGVEQHVQGLAIALHAAGHAVEVFARSSRDGDPGSVHEENDWHGCRVTRVVYRWENLESMPDLYRNPVVEPALREFLERRNAEGRSFDVAHVHHLTGLGTGVLSALRDAGVPTVLTLHDYWMMCPRGQMWHREEHPCPAVEPTECARCLTPTFGHWLPDDQATRILTGIHEHARATLLEVDRLLTPSRRTIPFFERLGIPADRIAVVENGVDTEGLGDVSPPRTTGPLRVGYLGTLIPSKGLDVLVRAFLSAFPGIAPPGEEGDPAVPLETATLETAILEIHGNLVPYHGDEGFESRVFGPVPEGAPVTWHGPYTTADLPRILGGIDVLVAPALWEEAFGLTVREAQAAGRPVIVSRIGKEEQDAVDEGVEGFIVTPGDAGELASRLRQLQGDRDLLRSMGAAARRRTRGFREMAVQLTDHYRDAAKLDPGASGP